MAEDDPKEEPWEHDLEDAEPFDHATSSSAPGRRRGAPALYGIMAEFDNPSDLVAAARRTYQEGYRRINGYSPYPIEELSEAIGFTRTSLPLIVLIGGTLGGLGGFFMQYWMAVIDYPLNVGGKPFNSFPLFIPVTFELTVLFSGLIAIAVLFARHRMWLFSKKRVCARVTDDRFVLVLKQSDASFDIDKAVKLFSRHHAINVEEGDQFV